MNQTVLNNMLGVSPLGGGRFVAGAPASHQLGDDGSVMMISGLGATGEGAAPAPATPTTVDMLQVPVTLFNVTLPLWAWLAIVALLGGGIGYVAAKKGA